MIDSSQEMIFYNDDKAHSYERQNMTILHEIGHIQLDHKGSNPSKEEAEAKFFAKYIIAPPPLVHTLKPESFETIHDHFDISFEAAYNSFKYYKQWHKIYFNSGYKYKKYEKQILTWYLESKDHIKGGIYYDL